MISKYKTRAIILIIVGIILQLLSAVGLAIGTEFLFWGSLFVTFAGLFCFLSGCIYYAEGKGYHWTLGLLLALFFNILALIILLFLPDRYKKGEEEKIPVFFPKGKKEKFLLIFTIVFLLVIWGIVGSQVIKLGGVGKEFEEATKAREELKKMVEEDAIIYVMEDIQEKLYDMQAEAAGYKSSGIYTGISCSHPSIKSFCDVIEAQLGIKPTMHFAGNAYCGYIRLPSGKYSCIDNNQALFAVTMTIDPSSPGYCDGVTFSCEKQEEKYWELNVLSPVEKEKWQEGQVHSIEWQQWGLMGERVNICLSGHKETSPGYYRQIVPAKRGYMGSCREGDYQIVKDISLDIKKYNWEIPYNLSDKFEGIPDVYTIAMCPSKEISEYCWRSSVFEILEGE